MDDGLYLALQTAVFLFVFALPLSLTSWAILFSVARLLPNLADQPFWIRFLTAHGFKWSGPRSLYWAAWTVVFIALGNSAAVILLVYNPYGWQSLVVDIAYLLVETILVGPALRSIVRSRSARAAK
jgi:hypothetical protein